MSVFFFLQLQIINRKWGPMRIFPAIDIKAGRCVRLFQGRADRETVYGDDPVAQAKVWAAAGASRIHVVVHDGAFDGQPKNTAIILRILKALAVEVEIGGGIRDEASARTLLDAGAARVVIGTRAAEEPDFIRSLAIKFPGKINLGLDASGGKVVTKGWVKKTSLKASDFVKSLASVPLGEVIYTDVARDGAMVGPNFSAIAEMAKASPFPIVASGGVTSLADLERLSKMKVFAAIIGKALYTGDVRLEDALRMEKA
jgi:phosphoribosylformimino-5-aminoimidazole carboxamide ribotide isomerase